MDFSQRATPRMTDQEDGAIRSWAMTSMLRHVDRAYSTQTCRVIAQTIEMPWGLLGLNAGLNHDPNFMPHHMQFSLWLQFGA